MTSKLFKQTGLLLFAMTILMVAFLPGVARPANAASPNVVISEVLFESLSASQEYIEIYNNSDFDVPLSGWVIQIQSANETISRNIPLSKGLKSHSYALIASTASDSCAVSDFTCFSGAMSFNGGHVVLLDDQAKVVDRLGWGNASNPEGSAAALPWLTVWSVSRKSVNSLILQDTDNNLEDFVGTYNTPMGGGLYEPVVTPDPGPQPDPAPVPEDQDTQNFCEGAIISEILPNPAGSDSGNEYVEIHNPTNKEVNLDGCKLKVDSNQIELTGIIRPDDYRVFFGLTLPNSAGGTVQLIDNSAILQVSYPPNMKDDESYGLIDGQWMSGLAPSPGEASAIKEDAIEDSPSEEELTQTICPPGKYRNPDTNRCKNIEVSSGLTACKVGQERNNETNRCRNISTASSSLKPCDSGQVRNEETNRCRKASTESSTLTPCKEGQERNGDTNRCRKVASANSTNPMENVKAASSSSVKLYLIGLVGSLGLGYGLYEYRESIRNFFIKRRQQA